MDDKRLELSVIFETQGNSDVEEQKVSFSIAEINRLD